MADIKKTLTDFTKNLGKSSSGLVNTAKLSIKLANEEENLKSTYISIGEKVREIYSYGGTLGEYFDARYNEILQIEKSVEQIRREIEAAKGLLPCPKCGKYVPKNATFCPQCGFDVLKAPTETAEAPIVVIEKKDSLEYLKTDVVQTEEKSDIIKTVSLEKSVPVKNCSICGKENEATEKFCFSCGRLL